MGVTFWPCKLCPTQCEAVFERVVVSYLQKGHTKVMWELLPTFTDPAPLTFRLQVGTTANPDADDWTDVGLPVVNQYFAVDPEKRNHSTVNWTHYRVLVSSALGQYTSAPTGLLGTLNKRDWLKARNLLRRQRTQFRIGEGQDGYLLKRRVTGQRCPLCIDEQTGEVRDPQCPSCLGTGYECGYYYPMGCVFASISPKARHVQIDPQRGTVDDVVLQARMAADSLPNEEDVWVNKTTDDRYYFHKVQHTAEVRGAAVLANVELRPIPYSSPIYNLEIPEQLRHLGLLP